MHNVQYVDEQAKTINCTTLARCAHCSATTITDEINANVSWSSQK
jgi:hypothetical protein